MQKREDGSKKVGKKGLFELSLCAKQLPGLPGRQARREGGGSGPLFSYVSSSSPEYRASPRDRDAARKEQKLSFSPRVSSLVIGRENERAEKGAIISILTSVTAKSGHFNSRSAL